MSLRMIGQVLMSLVGAIITGFFGSVVAVFLYDRGMSKGNDLAVALIGLHAIGTFTFVTLLTFLLSGSGSSSWKTPVGSLTASLVALLVTTILFSSAYDEYFAVFFLAGWISVAFSGMLAIAACKYILSRARTRQLGDSASNS